MLALPGAALAQRAGENAVTGADDAFGTNVGFESSGIYSEFDTRGFSPTKAGNVRIDGIYTDTIGVFAGRLRERTAIRVGFAAQDYPFHAPTGIVDHKFRAFPTELGASLAWHQQAYGSWIFESDLRLPIIEDHLSLTGGQALSNSKQADGSGNHGHGTTIRPILRLGGVEIAPYIQWGGFRDQYNHPLVVVTGDKLPDQAPVRRFLGQPWAKGKSGNKNKGVTVKAALTGNLSFRGGLFRADAPKEDNYTELFAISPVTGLASHRLISDPDHDIHTTSGEAQLAWRIASGRWQHRFIAGFRARNRYTESGGSVTVTSPRVFAYGAFDPILEQSFSHGPVNEGRVKQSAVLLGYTGKLEGLGTINLGVQKARYRGTFGDGRTGIVTTSRDDPWLYNATLGLELGPAISLYIGTEKGLEDSGAAPENAVNRAEQLPPTRTTQYEGGLRWKFHGGQLVVNAFQITKPYFTFDTTGNFTQLGQVRHRGVETSLSGKFGKRLTVVAGALAMQPRVTGGGRPVGTPSLFARADINYRTDLLGGLTPLATLVHTGSRPVNAQLTLPGLTTLDLGLRHQFHIGSVNASFRGVVQNVFDTASWKVVAANTLYSDEHRRFTLSLTADF